MPRVGWSTLRDVFRIKSEVETYEAVPLVTAGESDEEDASCTAKELTDCPPAQPRTLTKILSCLWSVIVQVWFALRPKILSPSGDKQQQQPATAWLNGARCGSIHPRFLELPIIRLFYSGAPMVAIFFVISGYALSFKPLGLMSKNQLSPIYNSLASSLFRRGIRLFAPTATIAFIVVWVGYLNHGYPPEERSREVNTILDALSLWFNAVICSVNPFQNEFPNTFHMPLAETEMVFWTIPVEYRGSLAVFGLLLILSRTQTQTCMGSLAVILLWLTYVGQWDIFLFTAGMACCQVSYMIRKVKSPTLGHTPAVKDTMKSRCRNILLGVLVPVLALLPILYVLSQPGGWLKPPDWPGWGDAPIYPTLDDWTPPTWKGHNDPGRFWTCISAIAFILLVDNTAIFRRFFFFAFPQYLGEISFSMYLVHPLIIKVVLTRWNDFVSPWMAGIRIWWIKECLNLTINGLVFIPVLFWVSDLLTRYVDRGSVDLARWLESRFYRESRRPGPAPANLSTQVHEWEQ
ncbi:hypothetical protein LTS07_002102 [Exophiala sideris]|uniref:Acyltransferase 3 domain-containing protein n=1 Tax=Exophiala sideris TaxID=1016849 RepID=A0ABR0JL88_9EURO|nr:hypothetical protein LTS07_002102 [Exophiala sideris]KAK5041793.1 hypothetical protein LTR13_002460 [Exophiala sideris]KAK5066759.1 hypothetical protein LTR69_002106 [Exophiala sideris]KAK5184817.1 hypothetical protein LTR44_002663 [Eurotiomycetes sp. CCFEE 6388]